MNYVVVEIGIRTAPLDVLERAASAADALRRATADLVARGAAREALSLATCNRVEIYAVAEEACAVRKAAKAALADAAGLSPDELRDVVRVHRGDDAVRHALRTACGLESMVLGEREILGQMRRAREAAERDGTAGPMLAALFRRAATMGRRVRHETDLARGGASVASVAAALTANAFADLAERRVLVLGAGATARAFAKNLRARGARHFVVANRTAAHAEELAREIGGRAARLDDLGELIADCDILAAATGATERVLGPDVVDAALARRESAAPVMMLDLAMPRNIDPAVGDIEGVSLCSLEDLEQIAAETIGQRAEEIPRIEAMIEEEVARHAAWLARGEAGDLADELRRRAEEVRRAHLERFGASLSEEERARAERLTASLVRALLHDATRNVRATTDDAELDAMRRLLNLPAPARRAP